MESSKGGVLRSSVLPHNVLRSSVIHHMFVGPHTLLFSRYISRNSTIQLALHLIRQLRADMTYFQRLEKISIFKLTSSATVGSWRKKIDGRLVQRRRVDNVVRLCPDRSMLFTYLLLQLLLVLTNFAFYQR